jgi:pSer/pThr/pTyr-binding forkhead associated (FHA) protein
MDSRCGVHPPCLPNHRRGRDNPRVLPRPATARELKAVIELERAGTPFLLYRDAAGQQQLHLLSGDAAVTIGRGDAVDLSLAWDPSVSSVHAEMTPLGAHWVLVDEGISRNGTFVNSERVSGRQRLRHGDVVRIGETSLAYHQAVPEPVLATVALDDGPVTAVTDAQRRVLVALCAPYRDGDRFAAPAGNQQIADELFLSVEAVKTHLRELYRRFGLENLPQNQKRMRLVERALLLGLAAPVNR